MPERIQLSRAKGWRKPPGAVVVSRPSKWGNPFVVGQTTGCHARETAVALYRAWLEQGETAPYPHPGETEHLSALREFVLEHAPVQLAGKSLACWCPLPDEGEPDICHAAVLMEYVEWAHRQLAPEVASHE